MREEKAVQNVGQGPVKRKQIRELNINNLSGMRDSQRDSRESILANHSQLKPLIL